MRFEFAFEVTVYEWFDDFIRDAELFKFLIGEATDSERLLGYRHGYRILAGAWGPPREARLEVNALILATLFALLLLRLLSYQGRSALS